MLLFKKVDLSLEKSNYFVQSFLLSVMKHGSNPVRLYIFISHIVEHERNYECLTHSGPTLLQGFLVGWAVLTWKWVVLNWRVGAQGNKTQTVSLHKDLFTACTHALHGSGRYSQINSSSIRVILAAVQSASMLKLDKLCVIVWFTVGCKPCETNMWTNTYWR